MLARNGHCKFVVLKIEYSRLLLLQIFCQHYDEYLL